MKQQFPSLCYTFIGLALLSTSLEAGQRSDRNEGETKPSFATVFKLSNLKSLKRSKSLVDRGRSYYQREDYGRAINAFLGYLQDNSRDADVWFNLGLAQHKHKKYKDSMVSFLTSYRYKSDLKVLYYAAQSQFNSGYIHEAVRSFKRILAHTPDHGSAWKLLGRCYETLHHIDRARMAYGKSLTYNPNDDQTKNWLLNLPKENSLDPSAIHRIVTPNNKTIETGIKPGDKIVTGSSDKDAILPASHILDVGVYGDAVLNIPGQLPKLEEVYHISYDAPSPSKFKPTSIHPNLKDSFKSQKQSKSSMPKTNMDLPDL